MTLNDKSKVHLITITSALPNQILNWPVENSKEKKGPVSDYIYNYMNMVKGFVSLSNKNFKHSRVVLFKKDRKEEIIKNLNQKILKIPIFCTERVIEVFEGKHSNVTIEKPIENEFWYLFESEVLDEFDGDYAEIIVRSINKAKENIYELIDDIFKCDLFKQVKMDLTDHKSFIFFLQQIEKLHEKGQNEVALKFLECKLDNDYNHSHAYIDYQKLKNKIIQIPESDTKKANKTIKDLKKLILYLGIFQEYVDHLELNSNSFNELKIRQKITNLLEAGRLNETVINFFANNYHSKDDNDYPLCYFHEYNKEPDLEYAVLSKTSINEFFANNVIKENQNKCIVGIESTFEQPWDYAKFHFIKGSNVYDRLKENRVSLDSAQHYLKFMENTE